MIRRPPRSTLFPTRRSSDLRSTSTRRSRRADGQAPRAAPAHPLGAEHAQDHEDDGAGGHVERSEEHTSELQSRLHLVCRLLLEKKKLHMLRHTYLSRALELC